MDIVVLDGYTLNPGDLNWKSFETIGNITVYDRTPREIIVERAKEADILLTNKVPLTAEIIAQLPKLRYIGVLATGYNVIDLEATKKNSIIVTNIPNYGTSSVAQHVFALLLELCNRVQLHSDAVFDGEWSRGEDFTFSKSPLIELEGKVLGIVGFGTIGQQTAQIGAAFGMKIKTIDRGKRLSKLPFPVSYVKQSKLFEQSDVISLNCPLTPETEGIINRKNISYMKSSAFLINTARGGLIVEEELANALNKGEIAGAGLDVLLKEPPSKKNPLLSADNCLITPHIAWATKEARTRLMGIAFENLQAFLDGEEKNVINQ